MIFQGFGDGDAEFASVDDAMESILRSLRADVLATAQLVNSTSYLFADKAAANSAVNTAKASVDLLDGEFRQRVLSGDLSFDEWKAVADQQGILMAQTRGYNNKWAWENVIITITQDAAHHALDSLKWLGLAVGGILAFQVIGLFKKR